MKIPSCLFPSFGKLHFVTKTGLCAEWCDPDVLTAKAEPKIFTLKSIDKRTLLLMCCQK